MKTSKIIFISFFGVIGLFLLSLLIQIDPDKKRKDLIENEAFAIPPFNHLVVEKGSNLTLIQDLADSIKLTYEKGIIISKPVYSMKGDTLVISPVASKDYCFIELRFRNLNSIQATNCSFVMNKISAESLLIEATSVQINFYDAVALDSLKIKLSTGSNLWCYSSTLKTVNLIADKSNVDFSIDQLAELKAELLDSSELSTWKVLRSDIKTDESSRYYSR
jgi:hypothetical protein